jgi:hypothetical protein
MFIYIMRVHLYQPLSLFFSQILFVWLIISISYWVAFLSIVFVDLAIHYFLSRALCLLGLLHSFSDNFVCCLLLLDQGHFFDVVIIHLIITSSYYTTCYLRYCITSSLWLDSTNMTSFYDDFEELYFGCNFLF